MVKYKEDRVMTKWCQCKPLHQRSQSLSCNPVIVVIFGSAPQLCTRTSKTDLWVPTCTHTWKRRGPHYPRRSSRTVYLSNTKRWSNIDIVTKCWIVAPRNLALHVGQPDPDIHDTRIPMPPSSQTHRPHTSTVSSKPVISLLLVSLTLSCSSRKRKVRRINLSISHVLWRWVNWASQCQGDQEMMGHGLFRWVRWIHQDRTTDTKAVFPICRLLRQVDEISHREAVLWA